jgi:hypothetical protein
VNNDLIIEELAGYAHDPLAFVLFAFPWGEPGSELEDALGPEDWQILILSRLRDGLITIDQAIRLATTSGHGIGKSALVSWIILWGISTYEDTIGVVTANTETQLKTKTWTQLAKWFRLFIGHELFEMTATKLCSRDPKHKDTWRVDMVPWSERNTEAFAGLHNKGKRIILVFDEASAIPDIIWEVSEGALTDERTEIIWAVFGNPTRNKGRFRECFFGGRFASRWSTIQVDSREVTLTNKAQIAEWIKDYGEDSDFVRVRVRGVFPRVDAESFIGYELAVEATRRTVVPSNDAIILGVDVGRFGDDPSVIYPRKGRDAVSLPIEVLYGADTMKTAATVAATFLRLRAVAVMVDSGGVGGGVVDRLRQLQIPVFEVDFGSRPDYDVNDGTRYANKRAEIWGKLRTWLSGGSIPERVHGVDVTLVDELTAPTYELQLEKIIIESKKSMRARGVKSPNLADALACTFAYDIYLPSEDDRYEEPPATSPDYNPFAKELF